MVFTKLIYEGDRNMTRNFAKSRMKIFGNLVAACFTAAIVIIPASAQQAGQMTFPSATQATKSLIEALQSNEENSILKILGPEGKDIVSSGDAAQDKQTREDFVQKYKQMHRLVNEPDGTTTLYIGAENWPTPIPLEHKNGAWFFDTAAGKEEILYRRIGKNEMSAIQVCHELVDAEKEYYAQPHDGDGGSQYAQKLSSDAGKHNGLYWEASAGQGESPIGPMIASATPESAQGTPEPFQGYYFRILKAQKDGGSYVVDGKMTRGFAFVAYPAEYRSSGVMTFIVDQDGVVYEKDLGKRTPAAVKKLASYDPNNSWSKARKDNQQPANSAMK
jgi:hypothetical protein